MLGAAVRFARERSFRRDPGLAPGGGEIDAAVAEELAARATIATLATGAPPIERIVAVLPS
ncbi:MAG TPA: hypothetical protein DEP35_19835 [Deltaproteobacteria bacterium]|nr:hypothetical protein [Deltaproteobacteria bacterium]